MKSYEIIGDWFKKPTLEEQKNLFFDQFLREIKKIKYFEVRIWEGFIDRNHFNNRKTIQSLSEPAICRHGDFYYLSVDDGMDLQGYYILIDMTKLELELVETLLAHKPRLHDQLHEIFNTLSLKRFPTKATSKKFGL